jgi:SAM-dependent methyltransferase
MHFRQNILEEYLSLVPIPLALERVVESKIYTKYLFESPILDIGCGDGVFARMLFKDKIDTGIDSNPKELKRARELGGYNELIACQGDAVPKSDNSYNTIFSNSVLEHIQNLAPVFQEIHRLLTPGGRFYFTVPSNLFDQYTIGNTLLTTIGLPATAKCYRKFFNNFWCHYHYYSLSQWKKLVLQYDFEIIDAFTYNSRKLCLLNDFLVPFSLPGFFVKKITNRWTIFPAIRRHLMSRLSDVFTPFLCHADRCEVGGLVFMALTKNNGSVKNFKG